MQLNNKPILIEGNPGVGKTSLVIALAKLAGYSFIRINLSEQTDISDLFGSDLPDVESGQAGKFKWHDGPLLTAIKNNQWIILDEVRQLIIYRGFVLLLDLIEKKLYLFLFLSKDTLTNVIYHYIFLFLL